MVDVPGPALDLGATSGDAVHEVGVVLDGSDFGELRLDWFRRSDKDFDVVLLYEDEKELERGKQLLIARGFQ